MENATNLTSAKNMNYHFGKFGACLPILTMIVFMIVVAITGKVSVALFCLAGFFGICVAFILAKDKKEFNTAVVESVKDETLSVLIFSFILAGILSQLLRAGGLIDGLTWLTTSMNLDVRWMPLICFITCALISTSCGTSNGSIVAVMPILLPVAVNLGAHPGLIVGAIVSGSIFGDNLAPISDTTIASAVTQGIEVKDAVRTRLPFSLVAGGISAVLYVIAGFMTVNAAPVNVELDPSAAMHLVLLLVPAVMIFLTLKGWSLVPTLIVCDLVGAVLCVVFGFISFADMLSASGPLAGGMTGMLTIILYCILVFALISLLKRSGIFEMLLEKVVHIGSTPRKAEVVTGLMSLIGMLTCAAASISIVLFGPVAKELLAKQNIEATRGSNILDGLNTSMGGIIPYTPVAINALGLALSSGVVAGSFSFLTYVPFCFHNFALILVFWVSILTGIGRRFRTK